MDTPEQLDRALSVTTSKAWFALCMLLVAVVAVVVWSVVGEVSTYVRADGVLLNRGGKIADAVTSGSGVLASIAPAIGDVVKQGAVVAETIDEEKTERYRSAVGRVNESARILAERRAAAKAENTLIENNVAEQRKRLERLELNSNRSVEVARERLKNHRQLFEERVITRETLERSQQGFDQAQHELFNILRRRDDLESSELRRRNALDARIADAESQLSAAKHRVDEYKTSLKTQRVLAPASGRVIEIKASVGAVLNVGQAVLSIETGGEGLEVLVYISPTDGKRVEAGMRALVSPSVTRREEFGSLIGAVEHVSEFPVSLQGMVAVLQNQDLAQTFSKRGPPYAGRVALESNPSTVSGFTWTSSKGADVILSPGTLASIEVEIESKPPIALVVPLIRETLGL